MKIKILSPLWGVYLRNRRIFEDKIMSPGYDSFDKRYYINFTN
ncbi:MAG: hypothetical protein ABI359_16160 [Ginsengibacter sp.]